MKPDKVNANYRDDELNKRAAEYYGLPLDCKVKIAVPISQMERDLMRKRPDEVYIVTSFEARGYVRCQDPSGAMWWLHPEALKKLL